MRFGMWSLGIFGLAIAGCRSSSDGSVAEVVVRDSAGVEIVTTNLGSTTDIPRWRLSRRPFLAVGERPGDPDHELYLVTYAKMLPDSGVVVANSREEIKLYSAGGEHIRTFGREGSGPGEFEHLWDVFVSRDDRIVAYDAGARRLSTFATTGELLGGASLQYAFIAMPNAIGMLANGRAVALGLRLGPDLRPSIGTQYWALLLFDTDGAVLDTIDVIRAREVVETPRGARSLELSPTAQSRASADHIYAMWTGEYAIKVYDADGDLERIIRTTLTGQPVTEEIKDAEGREYREGTMVTEKIFADSVPPTDKLMVTISNWVWVRDYVLPGEGDRTWHVFSPAGRLEGMLRTPSDLRITEVGDDYVVGVWRDDLDVESVRAYRVQKP